MPMPVSDDRVRCVVVGEVTELVTWCGRSPGDEEPVFEDAAEAAYNGRQRTRLMTCPQCAAAIMAALRHLSV